MSAKHIAGHVIQRILNPRFMAPVDVASDFCQALGGGGAGGGGGSERCGGAHDAAGARGGAETSRRG